jgi:hypothetical protein
VLVDNLKVILPDDKIILEVLVDQIGQEGKGRTFDIGIDLSGMNDIELVRLKGMVDQLSGDVVRLGRLSCAVVAFLRVESLYERPIPLKPEITFKIIVH